MNDDDIEFGNRLRSAREAVPMDPDIAASRMKIAYSTLMNHEGGHRGARKRASDYARLYGVNLVWLSTGAGPMKGRDPLLEKIQGLAQRDRETVEILVNSLGNRQKS